MAQIGPYVMHWYESEDRRNDWPALVGLEWEDSARWEVGGAVFRNSFFQSSVYIYGGRRWFLPELSDWRSLPSNLYIKLTGGPLYGYRGDYKDKVPFNHKGLGVAILPALGYQYQNANVQAVFLGTAAVIFTFGYDFY